MDEFFALVDFCNPGALGCDKEVFRRRFVNPMTAAREPGASQDIVDQAYEMSMILQRITQSFILRRTEVVNTQYLPPKGCNYCRFAINYSIPRRVYHFLLPNSDAASTL